MEDIIVVKNLSKKYGDFVAVDHIDFSVRKGQFFAFLGPNGAGKSTTINILCTLLKKTEGNIKICGFELDSQDEEIRRKIGVVFQENVLDDFLTVKENLHSRAKLYFKNDTQAQKEKYDFVVNFLDLIELENKLFKTLSGGQKRRVEIARALIGKPEILILDEPTTGLDPETRKTVWGLLYKLKQDFGVTIFLTTHYMEEASEADYVIVINKGKIAAQGTPNDLKANYSKDNLKLLTNNTEEVKTYLENKKIEYSYQKKEFIVKLDSTIEAIDIAQDLKQYLQSLEIIKGTLDDAFIKIIRG